MANKAGKGGSITFTGITVGVKSWTLDFGMDMLETTDFGDSGVEKYIGGITRWTATAVSNFDATNTADPGDTAQLKLSVDGTDYWQSEASGAILASYSVNTTVEGVVEITYNFQGTSTLTPPS